MKKLIAMLAFVLVSAPALAVDNNPGKCESTTNEKCMVVPEIDVSSGAKGLAVLIAGLLLAAEALRRRR